MGFVFNPSFVSKHISADGLITKATTIKINALQCIAVTVGVILFLYFFVKIISTKYSEIVDQKLRVIINITDDKITPVLTALGFIKNDSHPLLRCIIPIWLIFLLCTMLSNLLVVFLEWQDATGYEYLWIAESIESGHGFSFANCNGFESTSGCDKFIPSTHEEPIYPYLLSFATMLFGIYGRPAILILQVVALFFTSVFIYLLSIKAFNSPTTGILAGSILPLIPGVTGLAMFQFIPAIFAGLLYVILTYLLLWCLDKPSLRRGIILGLTLGFGTLLYAPVLSYIPIFVFFILILILKRSYRLMALKAALVVLFSAVIIISFWTTRNYYVTGHFVPVKTAFGYFFHLSNPVLAESFTPQSDLGSEDSRLKWKAKDARDAITLSRENRKIGLLMIRFNEIFKEYSPEGFFGNPAAIDKAALHETLKFISSNPNIFLTLTYYRVYDFLFGFGSTISVISLLSLISFTLILKNNIIRILALLISAYAFPYVLVLSWWYRYRYPIEPLILVLACYITVLIFSKLYVLCRKSGCIVKAHNSA